MKESWPALRVTLNGSMFVLVSSEKTRHHNLLMVFKVCQTWSSLHGLRLWNGWGGSLLTFIAPKERCILGLSTVSPGLATGLTLDKRSLARGMQAEAYQVLAKWGYPLGIFALGASHQVVKKLKLVAWKDCEVGKRAQTSSQAQQDTRHVSNDPRCPSHLTAAQK